MEKKDEINLRNSCIRFTGAHLNILFQYISRMFRLIVMYPSTQKFLCNSVRHFLRYLNRIILPDEKMTVHTRV